MEQKLATVNDIANKTFDFVIIGGGLSGCVLASRITENPNVSVAVLEAGNAHINDPLVTNPMGWMQQAYNPEYDWCFRTTPQPRAASVMTPDNKETNNLYWSRGKGLGGSSCMNFLFYTRPQREEIDAVEKLGNPGWNWDRYFKAAKRAESLHFYDKPNGNDELYHDLYVRDSVGDSGPVPVSFSRTVSGVEKHFQKALKEFGVPTSNDGLGGQISGTWKCPNNIDPRTGTRSTAATGYLYPALDRPNLKVLPAAYVHRVLTTNTGGEVVATGVEFEHDGKVYTVNVAKEAILSASTVKSPHILELSGIGNRKILESLGIPVVLDLPSVGENLQDHVLVTGSVYQMRQEYGFVTSDTIGLPAIQEKLKQLYGSSTNPVALTLNGVSFLPIQTFSDRADELIRNFEEKLARSSNISAGLKEQYALQLDMLKQKDVPDIEIVVFPFNMAPDGSGKPYVGILPSIGHPFTRGTIHAGSNDPKVQPNIEPEYLAEELDLDILVDSVKFIRKLTATAGWKEVGEQEIFPGAAVQTDEQLIAHIKKNLTTTWHASGTCSLMPKEKGGVVDTHLKVYGTKNIRVADLSILPLLTAVHTQATTYGIAEQAADIIKADNGL